MQFCQTYFLYIPQPIRQVVERLKVGDVVHENDAHSASVVCRGQGPEALLTSCVPDLQLDRYPVEVYYLLLEVYAWKQENSG